MSSARETRETLKREVCSVPNDRARRQVATAWGLRGPMSARGHRITRHPAVPWALDANPADAGPGMALFPAGVTASDCIAPNAPGTPWIADWRLRRRRLSFADQDGGDQQDHWQAHRGLPAAPDPVGQLYRARRKPASEPRTALMHSLWACIVHAFGIKCPAPGRTKR